MGPFDIGISQGDNLKFQICGKEQKNTYELPHFLEKSCRKWSSHVSDILLKKKINIMVFYITINLTVWELGFFGEL